MLGVTQLSTSLRGTLSGTVKNVDGSPVQGVKVTAVADGGGSGQITTTSAPDGTWAFNGLDVGAGRAYSLTFRDPAGAYLPLEYDARPSTSAPDPVRVVAGQTTTANAVMRRTATLRGAVRNSEGAAVAGVSVTAILEGAAAGSSAGRLTTTSAADGSWSFPGLDVTADRLYAVSFTDQAGAYLALEYDADPLTPASIEPVTVKAGQTATADAVLRRSCTLGGLVTDSRTGRPVAGVPVEAALAPGQSAGAAGQPAGEAGTVPAGLTDAAGRYAISGIPEGTYVLACKGAPPVYGVQYWPAAQNAGTATPITLTPSAPAAVADVVLHHDDTRPVTTALNAVKTRTRSTATLKYRVADAYGDNAVLTLVVATARGKVKARVQLGVRAVNVAGSVKWKPGKLAPGKYSWWIAATDLAGNSQSKAVRKSLTLVR